MRRLLSVILAALLLAGCTSLPVDGPVQSADPQIPAGYGVDVLAEGPRVDAAPNEIVEGFLRASAYGHSDDFSVASQYLAEGVVWDPLAQVRIFSSGYSPSFATDTDGGISVTVREVATVDDVGRYRVVDDELRTTSYTLVRNSDNQWRIASLADGLLVSDLNFQQTFGSAPLHFLTADNSSTVPELRWYPLENRAEHVVAGLLQGPSGWMEPGVRSAIPSGTRIGPGGVVVTDGVATVNLTGEILQANDQALALVNAQLEATLGAVSDVGSTEIRVGDAVLDVPDFAVDLALPTSAPGPVVIYNGELVRYSGGGLQRFVGAPDLSERDPRDPAVPYEAMDGPRVVVADGGTALLTVPDDGSELVTLHIGTDLVAPSIDRYGWIWTADSGNPSTLTAVRGDGAISRVGASWLEGRTLIEARIAADGARAVLVSALGDQTFVELVGVGRDTLGRPRALGEPFQIAESLSSVLDISWVDQTSLVVLGTRPSEEDPRVYRVPVGGPISVLPAVEGAASVASNRNERSVVVVTGDDFLYVRSGAGWRWVMTGVRDPAFSG